MLIVKKLQIGVSRTKEITINVKPKIHKIRIRSKKYQGGALLG
jgi:hypothetical protein